MLILCGGSATDLPEQTPAMASLFNVVDSFDTHARIPEHFAAVDAAARAAGKVAVISCGWDPGMFSLNRLYAQCILPEGEDYTFWGRGVSQGHSDAVRRIDGVKDARQYTIPVEAAVEAVRRGENPSLTTRQKHTREVFVVAEEGADTARIEREIKTMPNYFDQYDTTVHFISAEEMQRDHSGLPPRRHGYPHRQDRSCQGAQPRGGIQPQAGFQPRVHLVGAPGLRPGPPAAWRERARPAARRSLTSRRPIFPPRAGRNCGPTCCKGKKIDTRRGGRPWGLPPFSTRYGEKPENSPAE